MCAGRGSSNASAQLHAAKISKMKSIVQSAGMESSERTADPTVLQSTDLMSDKMLQGIYVEERSSSRTLSATRRSTSTCRATQTKPMPPRPTITRRKPLAAACRRMRWIASRLP